MQLGPVEVLIVEFPGSQFSGGILPALRSVVERGDITVVDFALVTKLADGDDVIVEVRGLADAHNLELGVAVDDLLQLLNEEDLEAIAEQLNPGDTAAALVIEHRWARELSSAVAGAAGSVVFSERIARDVVEAAVAAVVEAEEDDS